MKLNYRFFAVLMLGSNILLGQGKYKPLSIGDTLPVFTIPKIIHYSKKAASTNEFTKDLLILDFWGMECKSCIEIMPEMELLEKKIGSRLKVLPVSSYGKETDILMFWKNNKYLRNTMIPSVVEDTQFENYFPNKLIPHEVWIYKKKVIAITGEEYVTEQNIRKVLNNEKISWPVKNDYYKFDYSLPLFRVNKSQADSSFIRYSAISDYKDKVKSSWFTGGDGIVRDSIKKTIRAFFLNQPILNSYMTEWSRVIPLDSLILPSPEFHPNQTLWEVSDKSLYAFEEKKNEYGQDWIRSNGICFESLYTDSGQTNKQVHQSIISDLDRLLGLHVRWEKRKEKVLVVFKTNAHKENMSSAVGLNYKQYSIWNIVYNLNEITSNPYVFNESGNAEMKIPMEKGVFSDLSKVRSILQEYGFDLKEEYRVVHRLVFSEKDAGRVIDAEMQSSARLRMNEQKMMKKIVPGDNQRFLNENAVKLSVKTTSSGLQYKILREGDGMIPILKDQVVMHYEGRLVNGKIFYSTYEKGIPSEEPVNGIIKGWTEALLQMREGAIWEVVLPAELAFGIHTGHGLVPPNSTLIYKIELIRIKR